MKPIYAHFGGALVLTLVIAACVPQPRQAPPPVQTPRPVATPTATPSAPPPVANWMDAPQAPGDWRYGIQQLSAGQFSSATFNGPDGATLFEMACSGGPGQNILLRRSIATVENKTMTIRAESTARSLVAPPDPEGRRVVTAVVRPADRLLDAMALSKGRFAVEVPGAPTLYLPSWAEVTRVIEDCR